MRFNSAFKGLRASFNKTSVFLSEPRCTMAENLRNFDAFVHRASLKHYMLETKICSYADRKVKGNSKPFRKIVFLLYNVIEQTSLLCG
jgi:hypothetical protein